jgi:hypothetical protein
MSSLPVAIVWLLLSTNCISESSLFIIANFFRILGHNRYIKELTALSLTKPLRWKIIFLLPHQRLPV